MNSPVGPELAHEYGKPNYPDATRAARDGRASARLQKLARLRTAMSMTNRAIIRSESAAEVYRAVCRACVEQTDVKLVWIGLVDGTAENLVPIEIAGSAAGYLDWVAISLAQADVASQEPAAVAFRENRALFCQDVERDGIAGPWRERALQNGLRALIALPLLRGGQPYGMLAAYGSERNFFDPDSVEMLLDIADNVSFAIDQFDRAEDQRLAEEQLRAGAAERALHAERVGALSRRVVAVQEHERRSLARELHDRANPNLAAVKLMLASIESALPATALAAVKPMLLDVHGLVDDTVAGIRETCADLRPTLLDYTGLVSALDSYADMFMKRTGVPVRLTVSEQWDRLDQETECMLFRVAQEALTNCAKHACARNVKIALERTDDCRVLTICDDGFGFEPGALGRSGSAPGHGLLSMRERAEFAGAKFSLTSHALRGTEVRVELHASAGARRDAVPAVALLIPETL